MRRFNRVCTVVGALLMAAVIISCVHSVNRVRAQRAPTLEIFNGSSTPIRVYERRSYRFLGSAYPGRSCISLASISMGSSLTRLIIHTLDGDFVTPAIDPFSNSWKLDLSLNTGVWNWEILGIIPSERCER